MNKMWKNDGEEQKQLEKMLREKEVNVTMKPSDVQRKYPVFHGFTAAVFRKHWNATKSMFATNVPGSASGGTNDEIIEIDGVPPTKIAKLSLPGDASSGNVLFTQPPIVSTVFTDPVTRQDVCLVVISLLSRIKKIDFDVIPRDDSHVLQVSYAWPQYSYNCEEMFKKEWENRPFVDQLHPKYQAVEKALENVRENVEDAPQGKIEVTLPANVQLDPSTWKNYSNKKSDGMLLVFFEFLCARSDYIIKKKEKFMILE